MNKYYISKFVFALFLLSTVGPQSSYSQQEVKKTKFQDKSWICRGDSSLETRLHNGKESLRFKSSSKEGIALLEDVCFREGTIEMDLASVGRSAPTIAFYVSRDGREYDRLIMNPVPFFGDGRNRRLRQGIVTTGVQNDETYTVLTFHIGDEKDVDITSWFHLRVTIEKGICKVFYGEDTEPMFVGGSMFQTERGARIGIAESECFISNVKTGSLPKSNNVDVLTASR